MRIWRLAQDMKLSRRKLLQMGAVSAPLLPHVALATEYPARPVRLVLGLSPGGSVDMVTRIVAQALSEFLGQPFVIENKPGAAGDIATEAVVRATPDGYTLLVVLAANAINATLHQKLKFSPVRDLAMVAGLVRVPNVMEVNPAVPANSVPEFIAYAKANPGKLSYASGGTGSSLHMIGEMFKMMAGIDIVHVPYRGAGPAMVDLMAGQVQMMFNTMSASLGHVKGGKIRALGVATKTAQAALPDVPTVAASVPGYEASFWTGIAGPKGTPAEVVDKVNKDVNASLADAKLKSRLDEWGATALTGSPADFGKFVADETEKWGKVIRTANIKLD
jgi:tripartite-type tricarboxylate transporter receptor subunit TctC